MGGDDRYLEFVTEVLKIQKKVLMIIVRGSMLGTCISSDSITSMKPEVD